MPALQAPVASTGGGTLNQGGRALAGAVLAAWAGARQPVRGWDNSMARLIDRLLEITQAEAIARQMRAAHGDNAEKCCECEIAGSSKDGAGPWRLNDVLRSLGCQRGS